MKNITMHGTTIMAVLKDGKLAIGGDGQVTIGDTVVKQTAIKVRRIYKDRVLAGFAGSVADAVTLLERCEEKLDQSSGNLQRAVYALAKDWRTDRMLRRLEAMLIVGNTDELFLVSGSGEVIRPEDDMAGIGSGGGFALAAARALRQHSSLTSEEIVRESLIIAAGICIYTNSQIEVVTLP